MPISGFIYNMVMKVGKINPVLFKNTQSIQKQEQSQNNIQITELGTVTPDFAVQIPQKYTALEPQKNRKWFNHLSL